MTNEFSHLTEEIDKLSSLSKGILIDVTYTLTAQSLNIFIQSLRAKAELNYHKIGSAIFNSLGEERTTINIIAEIKQKLMIVSSVSTVCKAMSVM